MKFLVDTSRLDQDLLRRYADVIERDTQRMMTELAEEFRRYRCETHGDQLAIQISWGPNIHSGVLAGYRLEGCCREFEEEVFADLDGDVERHEWKAQSE